MAELISSTKVGNTADGFCLFVSSRLLKWLVTGLTLYLPKGVCGPAAVQWPFFRKPVWSSQTAQCYIAFLLKDQSLTTGLPLPPCTWRKCEMELDALLLSLGFVVWHLNHCYDMLVLPVVTEVVPIKNWKWKERAVWTLGASLCGCRGWILSCLISVLWM